jgi:vancomycin resistance protein YoaR
VDQLEATGHPSQVEAQRGIRRRPPDGAGPTPGAAARSLGVLAVAAVAVGVLATLWAVDTNAHSGDVGRKVTLGGRSVSGMPAASLSQAVQDLAARYRDATVVVSADGGGFQATADELGLSVVQDRTAADAMAVGRRGFVLARMWSWARGFVAARPAPVAITVDEGAMARIVAERDPQRAAPVEPSLTVKDDKVVPRPGEPGKGISPPSVLAALRRAGPKGLPLRISVARDSLPPRFPVADAQRLADTAEQLVGQGLPVVAGPSTATVAATALRGWFRAEVGDDGLRLAVDASTATAELAKLFPAPVVAPVSAGFTVSGGKVSVTPSKAGTACCGPGAPALLQSALLNRSPDAAPVILPLKTVAPARDEDAARKLAVTEQIGTFTTNHAAGEPRVTNIHRIADIVQGAVIEPGATFSLNDFVGPRTGAKGFVDAPIIDEHYNFKSDIGGGISQFATTIFNAAFFSGLDITSYYMHGIYISRYPYGRESTVSYPSPDVRIRNNTPYGVLIWPTYTDTSVSVTMYSTKYVSGEQTGQTTEPKGPCTAVTTERTRTYVDGRKAVDHFSGLYSPKEGVECP